MSDDQFLYGFQQQPRPAFSKALLHRLTEPQPARPVVWRRLAWGFLAAVLLFSVSLLAFPTVRTYAQAILYHIGHLILSDAPTYAEQYEESLQTAAPSLAPSQQAVEWQANPLLTLGEAQVQAGFRVAELTNLPSDLTLAVRRVNLPDDQNPYTAVITVYQSADQMLTLRQLMYEPWAETQTLPVGDALVQEVQLRGSQGLWIENLRLSTYVEQDHQVALQYANLLRWSEDAFEFELSTSPGLSLETMLQMAEAIQRR